MNTAEQMIKTFPTPGTPMDGGYYVGRYQINGEEYALIAAPKATGEHADTIWHSDLNDIEGAQSYNDGQANTQAMADAGSALAQWSLALDINGFADWYLPSLDELELCYRALKPTDEENTQWARSGINLSAAPPTWPYTADIPAQTNIEAFRSDGTEAFEVEWYWSSTQHAADSGDAWCQNFDDGYQYYDYKNLKLRARAVRKIKI